MFGFGKSRKKGNDPRTGKIVPEHVQYHRKHECVRIGGTTYYQDALEGLSCTEVDAIVEEWPDGPMDYKVTLVDSGEIVGSLSDWFRIRAGIQVPCHVTLEVARPQYFGEGEICLYLPRTREIMALEESAVTLTVDESKWPKSLRNQSLAFDNAVIKEIPPKGSGKPSLAVMVGRKQLYVASPRMKAYKLLEENASKDLVAVFTESKFGRRGEYYSIEMLFAERDE